MELKRSVLLPHTAEAMFDLIEQAEAYPQFLPWCTAATILERSDDWVAARIEFSYLKLRFGFQTRNPKRRPHWLQVRLVEGPFKHFRADWHLTPLGEQGCKVVFELSFEIAEGMLDKVAAVAVDAVSRAMMDAFVKRAEDTLAAAGGSGVPALPASGAAGTIAPMQPPSAPRETGPPAAAPTCTASPAGAASAGAPSMSPMPTETAMTTSDTAHFAAVRHSPLARELSDEQTAVLAGVLTLAHYPAGQVIAREGSSDSHLYVVVDGSLGVVKHLGSADERLLATLGAGDFAHELGFLDGAARWASLVAAAESHVLVLERQNLESLIDTHPRILYRVLCAIVRTVHGVQTRLSVQADELTNYIVKQHGRY